MIYLHFIVDEVFKKVIIKSTGSVFWEYTVLHYSSPDLLGKGSPFILGFRHESSGTLCSIPREVQPHLSAQISTGTGYYDSI